MCRTRGGGVTIKDAFVDDDEDTDDDDDAGWYQVSKLVLLTSTSALRLTLPAA